MAATEKQSTEIKLDVPWGHVAAKTYGPSTGEPVLLVHGVLDNAGSFTRLMKYLPSGYYYVCIDLPGHGWSSHFPSWQILNASDFVYTLNFILEALEWQTCIYIGHSFGGHVGMILSVLQPHRFRKLILLDAISALYVPKDSPEYSRNGHVMKAKSNANPSLYTKEEVLYALKNLKLVSLNSDAAEALFDRAVTEINGKYKYNRDERLKAPDVLLSYVDKHNLFIRKITVPLYIINASESVKSYPHIQKAMKSINPKTPFHVHHIDGNHNFHINNPELVAPYISKILSDDNSSKL